MFVRTEKKMKKPTLRDVIFEKMNILENHFLSNDHLDDEQRESIEEQIAWVSKFWRVLNDADRDWIHCARDAFEEKREWKL